MTDDLLADLPHEFATFLDVKGLDFSNLVQADLLASILGSQMVLFAGPSGTGKSTAARAVTQFFAGNDRSTVIDVRRQWSTPASLTGYYSPIAQRFLPTENLHSLVALSGIEDHPPFVLLEEANLSPIEGYLNPAIHSLSHPITESLTWPLHASGPDVADPSGRPIPEELHLGRFPRFLGTINVDATAHAPANKVSGRACVIVLDPPALADSATVIDALWGTGKGALGVGASAIGDPGDALNEARYNGTSGQLAEALDSCIRGLSEALEGNPVTQRDQQRCLMYMAFFAQLATRPPMSLETSDALEIAAENSVLHFVLPGLVESDFALALEHLDEYTREDGVVRTRAKRLLRREGQDAFGPPLDFWSATT